MLRISPDVYSLIRVNRTVPLLTPEQALQAAREALHKIWGIVPDLTPNEKLDYIERYKKSSVASVSPRSDRSWSIRHVKQTDYVFVDFRGHEYPARRFELPTVVEVQHSSRKHQLIQKGQIKWFIWVGLCPSMVDRICPVEHHELPKEPEAENEEEAIQMIKQYASMLKERRKTKSGCVRLERTDTVPLESWMQPKQVYEIERGEDKFKTNTRLSASDPSIRL